MTINNTIEGIHLFPVNGELLYKPKAKKYYWHIPKALQDNNIPENSVIREATAEELKTLNRKKK